MAHRRRKGSVVGGHHDECGARAYNGSLGAEPPVGSKGRAPGQGVRGAKPPEAESILVIGCPTEPANLAPVRTRPPRLRRLWYGGQSVGLVTNKVHCKLQEKEK